MEKDGDLRLQKVDIYFKFIGQIGVDYTEAEIEAMKEQIRQAKATKKVQKKKHRAEYSEEYRIQKRDARRERLEGHSFEKRICEWCGNEYYPKGSRAKFCCEECHKASDQQKREQKRLEEKEGHTFRQKNCKICGKPFWPTNGQQEMCKPCSKVNTRNKQRTYYHSHISEKLKQQNREHREQLMAENEGHLIPKRICEYCRKEYYPNKNLQKYCSKECGKKGYAQMDNDRDPTNKEGHKFYMRACTVCGQMYWPGGPNSVTVTISVSSMDYRQGASYYAFDPDQKEQLYEIMRPEYYQMFAQLTGDLIGNGGEYGFGLDINPDLPPNEQGYQIVQAAKRYIGRSYSSMDCSTLARTAYADCGLTSMNGLSSMRMAQKCLEMGWLFTDASQLQAGDLIFFASFDPSRGPDYCNDRKRCGDGKCRRWMHIHHVAIYINDEYLIDSTGGDNSVQIRKHWGMDTKTTKWVCYGRPTQ